MSNEFIDIASSLMGFFIFSVVVTTLCGILIAFSARRISIFDKKTKFANIFFGLNEKGKLLLSVYYLRLLFIIYSLMSITIFSRLHYMIFVILTVFILLLNFKRLFTNVFNAIVIAICIETASIIIAYNTQIYYYSILELIYWLLALFIVLFTIYDIVRNLDEVSKLRRKDYEEIKY